ncbi:MAG: ParA family protein [Gemmataceae bacterium]
MYSPNSVGEPRNTPRVLAIASHKGGTGRTTLSLGLAWVLGQQGLNILLVDPDPTRSAALVACDAAGVCRWKGVDVATSLDPTQFDRYDLVLIDCPSLNERAAIAALKCADWLILTCLADTLSLRTLPAAAAALREARAEGGQAVLLGLVLNLFDANHSVQNRLYQQLQLAKRPPLLGAPIPVQPSLREWPLHPGSAMPSGPARAAVLELAFSLRDKFAASTPREVVTHA